MDSSSSNNNDLVWALDALSDKSIAQEFVLKFENRLCVYSPSVQQVYSNYSMHFPIEEDRNLIILPSPYAFHDTFNHVNNGSVLKTGMHIIPGEVMGRKGLYLLTLSKSQPGKFKPISLPQAIEMITKQQTKDNPFLPVLVKGDLKPFRSKVPCLHLHRLNPNKIEGLSQFEVSDIRNCLHEKFVALADVA